MAGGCWGQGWGRDDGQRAQSFRPAGRAWSDGRPSSTALTPTGRECVCNTGRGGTARHTVCPPRHRPPGSFSCGMRASETTFTSVPYRAQGWGTSLWRSVGCDSAHRKLVRCICNHPQGVVKLHKRASHSRMVNSEGGAPAWWRVRVLLTATLFPAGWASARGAAQGMRAPLGAVPGTCTR